MSNKSNLKNVFTVPTGEINFILLWLLYRANVSKRWNIHHQHSTTTRNGEPSAATHIHQKLLWNDRIHNNILNVHTSHSRKREIGDGERRLEGWEKSRTQHSSHSNSKSGRRHYVFSRFRSILSFHSVSVRFSVCVQCLLWCLCRTHETNKKSRVVRRQPFGQILFFHSKYASQKCRPNSRHMYRHRFRCICSERRDNHRK